MSWEEILIQILISLGILVLDKAFDFYIMNRNNQK